MEIGPENVDAPGFPQSTAYRYSARPEPPNPRMYSGDPAGGSDAPSRFAGRRPSDEGAGESRYCIEADPPASIADRSNAATPTPFQAHVAGSNWLTVR